ncbi:MAG: hypothetical protein ACXWW0_08330 [Bacteroidia bacterium]
MKDFVLFLTLCFGATGTIKAQHQNLLNPQSKQEIQKFKEQKVAAQSAFFELNGSQTPFGIAKYDAEGRILTNITPKKRQYFTYDANGRLSNFIDSAHDGRRFWPNEYAFAFDAEGRPANFQLGKQTSNFTYNPVKRELTEVKGSATTIYRYNEENKITEEVTEGGDEPKTHKYLYNKYGDLVLEIIAKQNANGTDTTRISYAFDSKGKLLRKQIAQTTRMNESEDPTIPPTVTKNTKIITYAYDIRTGLLTSENIVSSNPKESGKTEWLYDNTGLPVKESKLDAAGKQIQALVYKYSYIRQ